jgi:four helix bundle protein
MTGYFLRISGLTNEMGFRFESLEIYKFTLKISGDILLLVKELQINKQYILADQLFRACLSISNNIAEGSGSNSNKEFAYFLNIARRSVFECANMIIILKIEGKISEDDKNKFLTELDQLSRKIQSLRKTILIDSP